ncbi:metalloprotease, partial [Kickxella alabastrina]
MAQIRAALISFKETENEINNEARSTRQRTESLKKEIASERARLHEKDQGGKEQLKQTIASLEESIKNEESKIASLQSDQLSYEERSKDLSEMKGNCIREVDKNRIYVEKTQQNLDDLRRQTSNRLNAFGRGVPEAIAQIKNTRWKGMHPIGPIGEFVKVRDQKWSPIIETTLDKSLNAFLVDSYADQATLDKIFRQVGCQSRIVICKPELFDYSNGEPSTEYLTILRALEISNELVKRQLINLNRIEQIILVEQRALGDKIMVSNNGGFPRNVTACLTVDGFSVGSRSGGLSTQSVNLIKNTNRLGDDIGHAIAREEHQLSEQKRALDDAKRTLEKTEHELRDLMRKHELSKSEVRKCKGSINKFSYEIEKTRDLLHSSESTKIAELESELERLTAQMESIQTQFLDHNEQKKAKQEELKQLGSEIALVDKKIEAIRAQATKLKNAADAKTDESRKHSDNIVYWQTKCSSMGGRLKELEKTQVKAREEVQSVMADARKLSEERVEVQHPATKLDRMITECNARLLEIERSSSMSLAEVSEKAQSYINTYNKAKDELRTTTRMVSMLKTAHQRRLHMWTQFRDSMTLRTKMHFTNHLYQRGYTGKLEFDHSLHTLVPKVQTDQDLIGERAANGGVGNGKSSAAYQRKDTKSLSGGEKSFTTICLLLSLWETMNCPVRALDEFDVFMDAANRAIAMSMMIDSARSKNETQFILITPLDMSTKPDADITILRLQPPNRQSSVTYRLSGLHPKQCSLKPSTNSTNSTSSTSSVSFSSAPNYAHVFTAHVATDATTTDTANPENSSSAASNLKAGFVSRKTNDLQLPYHEYSGTIEQSPNDPRKFRLIQLPNNMTVLCAHDPDTTQSAVSLSVNVGHNGNPPEFLGIAHFLEHMLFQGALARFSRFFIDPLMDASCVDKELLAVDSEHKGNIQSDTWRFFGLLANVSNPNHPFSQFSTGTVDTLKGSANRLGVELRDELLKFHNKYYSSDIMKLVVAGNHTLDQLTEWAVSMFSEVESKGNTKPVLSEHTLSKSELGRVRGWITDIDANSFGLYDDGSSMFYIGIDATPNGMDNYTDIVRAIFAYMDMLTKQGLQEWYHDELRSVNAISYHFYERSNIGHWVTHMPGKMHNEQINLEHVLSAGQIIGEFNSSLVADIISYLNPNNYMLMVGAKKHRDVECNIEEQYYGIKYNVVNMPATLKPEQSSFAEYEDVFSMLVPNAYLTSSLDIKTSTEIPLSVVSEPTLLRSNDKMKVWFKQDDQFFIPKGKIVLSILVPATNTLMRHALVDLYNMYASEILHTELEQAQMAGLHYHFAVDVGTIDISISGFSDKQSVLLQDILCKVQSLSIDEQLYEMLLAKYIDTYKNMDTKIPLEHAIMNNAYINIDASRHYTQIRSELDKITIQQLQLLADHMFDQTFFKLIVSGNFDEKDALDIAQMIDDTLDSKPLADYLSLQPRALNLDAGRYVYQAPMPDKNNKESATICYVYCGQSDDIYESAVLDLLDKLVSEPFFDQLRTKEQLGYR